MLPKRQRLTSAGVQRVLKKPFRGKEGDFRYSWRENRAGYPRCAVVVTKGVAIGSVQRNRIRRVLYAALEEGMGGKTFAADMVLFIRSTPDTIGRSMVLPSLVKLISSVSEAVGKMKECEKAD